MVRIRLKNAYFLYSQIALNCIYWEIDASTVYPLPYVLKRRK